MLNEPTLSEVKPPRNLKKKGHKDKITRPLPTTVIDYKLTGEDTVCCKCGAALQEMKTEIRREVKVIPAQIQVAEHVQHVYVCRSCDREGTASNIVYAPMPNPVLRNSLASPSMIAYIMNRKYAEAIPLYRQEQQFKKVRDSAFQTDSCKLDDQVLRASLKDALRSNAQGTRFQVRPSCR